MCAFRVSKSSRRHFASVSRVENGEKPADVLSRWVRHNVRAVVSETARFCRPFGSAVNQPVCRGVLICRRRVPAAVVATVRWEVEERKEQRKRRKVEGKRRIRGDSSERRRRRAGRTDRKDGARRGRGLMLTHFFRAKSLGIAFARAIKGPGKVRVDRTEANRTDILQTVYLPPCARVCPVLA